MVKFITLVLLSLLIISCSPEPTMPLDTSVLSNAEVSITRIGVFSDDLAYNSRRGIYRIKDNVTGKEFIGVSGIGISEIGSHSQSTGKSTTLIQDER